MRAMRAADLPEYYNAVDILERNLPQRGDKVALYSRARNMTFQEVSDEVNQVGNALKDLGVHFGEYVGILSPDLPEWVTSFFGTVKIGAIAIGMNTLLTPREYEYILRDSRARVLVVHESLLPKIDSIRDNLLFLKHVVVIAGTGREEDLTYSDWLANYSKELEAEVTHRDDFCTLNYSSGTTGQPKGILHAHKDYPLTAQLWGVNILGLRESDRTFSVAKLFFTFGLGGNLIFPWYAGASIALLAGPPRIATNVLEMIDEFKPTILYNAPTSYAAILAEEDFAERYDLSSLRLCVSAGEALPAPLWHRWKEETGLDIIDGIGSTENFHIFISNRPDDIRPGSSGKPFPGYDVKIIDRDGNEVPQGEIGDLLVKGETAALFYLHQYERSQQTFRGEWLFTGDKYYVDEDGYYWHAGRSDDMMKVGGIWVSPVEVESTLIGHPSVLECAIVEKADAENLVKPKAFVVLTEGYEPTDELAEELIEHCRREMAGYKRPRWIEFVDELPKTATGKIQRFKLREQEA
ncbi:MAG: benzoate-CoA ligase family protein [Chloroflexota bacterium]|nr:benzoate-CoA ligase family protein [Chloroflexota bacterium]